MQVYNKEKAIRRIDSLASEQKPFVFLISYDMAECYVEEPADISPSELLYDFNGITYARPVRKYNGSFDWKTYPVSYADYQQSFDIVRRNIYGGNSFLTNLTCVTPLVTNLSLQEIFECSNAKYRLYMKDRFVVFSPEIFVRIDRGCISSYPMKGTIDATLPDARSRLLNDKKESAEHATITDLIRNDLSRIADKVTVTRYRYIDELQTNRGRLLQMSSEITGQLPDDYLSSLGSRLFELLPAGSITGAPKCKTVSIIAEAETYSRGFYTGVMGYFNGRDLDSAVMIRFIEQTGNGFVFKSGGGITSQSDCRSEYEEMKQKVYVPIY